jgi:Spy/CpxP family protein refolding chaperone
MFGFFVGTLCLVGFFGVLRRRHWRYHGFYGRGFHRHGWHGGGCGGGRFGHHGNGGGWVMYRAFQELDTSPGQEKAIRSALGELRESLSELRPELRALRSQVAKSLSAEQFDAPELEASLERQAAAAGRIGPVFASVLGRIHEALDPDQRRRLARLVESGPGYCAV